MDESTRLESEQVAVPRGFESHRLLQGMAAIGAAHRLESGWVERLYGFDSHPFLQAW